jgi:hypothetical protein
MAVFLASSALSMTFLSFLHSLISPGGRRGRHGNSEDAQDAEHDAAARQMGHGNPFPFDRAKIDYDVNAI